MIMTSKRRLTSAVAILCAFMILMGIFPMNLFSENNEVNAVFPSDYNNKYIYFDTTGTPWEGNTVYIALKGWSGFAQGNPTESNNNIFYWDASTYTDSTDPYLLFAKQGTWTGMSSENRSEIYSTSVSNARGKIFTIDSTKSSSGYYNIKLSDDSPDGSIKASTKEEPFHQSSTTTANSGPSTNNVLNGSNYKVGDYSYTGKYLTFKSDFYDYLSDEEVTNGRGNITNSNSAGYTDPYTTLNNKISSTDISDKKITVNFKNKPSQYTYVYAYSGNTKLFGIWPGKKIDAGNITINNSNNYDTIYLVLNDGIGGTSTNNQYPTSGGIDLNASSTCTWTVDLNNLSNVTKEQSFPNGSINYTYPLYFGCFYESDDNDGYTSSNIPAYANFSWLANISKRDSTSTSVSGLVGNSLSNGNLLDKNGSTELPYLNSSWADENNTVAQYWKDIDFPFYEVKVTKDKDGNSITDNSGENPIYYQFNSRDTTSLYFDTDSSKIKEHTTAIMSQPTTTDANGTKGFFPFNLTASTDGKTNNLGFGTKFTINFTLSEDGKIKGLPTTFEFMGDDDVWVFVDDELALDMGGAHKDAYGKLDFSTLKYNLESNVDLTDSNKDNLTSGANSKTGNFTIDGVKADGTYDTTKVHTLTMYYMERGMFESDLFVRFNFTRQNSLTVENKLNVNNVNSGLQNKTKVAANFDVFDYTLTNTNITTNTIDDVSGDGLKYASGTSAERTVKGVDGTTSLSDTNTKLDTTSAGTQTGNFNQSAGAVANTNFERYDSYFTNNIKNVTGRTNSSGNFYLLYDETASFKRQFYSDSTMTLVQSNSLRKLTDLSTQTTLENKNTDSTRTASNFYSTVWSLVDIKSEKLGEQTADQANVNGVKITDNQRTGYTNGQFTYQNQEDTTNTDVLGVELKATYTNSPRVGSLKITKNLLDTSDNSNQEFTIKLKLTNIFGQSEVDAGTGDSINYTVKGVKKTATFDSNSIAEIKLKNGETAIINNIPVGTKYEISEDDQGNFKKNSITVANGDITESTEKTAIAGIVTNERKTGSLTLNKELTAAETGATVTDSDKAQSFTFTVTLESTDFDLDPYYTASIKQGDSTISWTITNSKKITKTFEVSKNTPVTISNIPYGTSYTVTETNVPSGWTKITTGTTGTISSTNQSATITNQKQAQQKATLVIQKYDKADEDKTDKVGLSGAKFQLYDAETDGNKVGAEQATNSNGKATFDDLEPNKTYWIEEVQAPAGYQKLLSRISVTTGAAGSTITRDLYNAQIVMPSAGGEGKDPFNFVLFGAIAIALAGGILLLNKKYAFLHKGKSSKEVQ